MKTLLGSIYLDSFGMFPEYFISVSGIYILIVVVLTTYNVYGLMIQKAISNCMALIMFMSCYLLLNDDLFFYNVSSFHNSINNDSLSFCAKFIICFSSAFFFLIISNFLKRYRLTSFEYLFILLFSILGIIILCSSNDLLTAYLCIELTSLSSYILASFRKSSNYSVESGLKYFVTGALSSAFFLLGSSFIYGVLGTINFYDFKAISDTKHIRQHSFIYAAVFNENWIDVRIPFPFFRDLSFRYILFDGKIDMPSFEDNLTELGLFLILLSLFIKLGVAPFHLWSLDVYEGSPTISTFFFSVISKVGIFVVLIRLCFKTLISLVESWYFFPILIAVLSVFVGSFGGLKTRKIKTLLAYSSISHMGYTLLAFSNQYLIKGSEMILFYLIIYIIAGLTIWFIILLLRIKSKSSNNKYSLELGDLSLLYKSNPALALSLSLSLFSLAGVPPMIGFLAKTNIFLLTIYNKFYMESAIIILCGVISTFYYIRVIKVLYFENVLVGKLYYPIKNQNVTILSLLVFLLIFLLINPSLVYLIVIKALENINFFTLNR